MSVAGVELILQQLETWPRLLKLRLLVGWTAIVWYIHERVLSVVYICWYQECWPGKAIFASEYRFTGSWARKSQWCIYGIRFSWSNSAKIRLLVKARIIIHDNWRSWCGKSDWNGGCQAILSGGGGRLKVRQNKLKLKL